MEDKNESQVKLKLSDEDNDEDDDDVFDLGDAIKENSSKSDSTELKTRHPKFEAIKSFFFKVCTSSWFQWFITTCIIVNTIILGLDKFPSDPSLTKTFEILNNFFFYVFFAEMLIKITGLGPQLYVKDSYNIFDCFIGKPPIAIIL